MTGYPDKPEVSTSYTGFQQSQGTNVFPGTAMDEDLSTLKQSIDEVIDFIKASFRSDGKLNNGLVTKDSLAASILFGIDPPVPWAPSTAYLKDQTVSFGNGIYIAAADHTSGLVFATDLAAVKWNLVAQFSVSSTPDDLSVTTPKIVDGAVTTPKLAAQSVTTAKIADHAVGATQLDASLTFVPVGAEIDYAGIRLPAKWLWCNGQPYSRTTYATLFDALSETATGDVVLNSPTISNLNKDLRLAGMLFAKIEGVGIPTGAFISVITATTITLNTNATSTGAARALRIIPYGNGDGSTTFNVPDRRGRVTAGRDDMQGFVAGRLTATLSGAALAATAGAETHLLSTSELPAFTPSGNVLITYPAHLYLTPQTSFGAGAGGTSVWTATNASLSTAPPGNLSHTLAMNPIGGGAAMSLMQPTSIANKIIFAGV